MTDRKVSRATTWTLPLLTSLALVLSGNPFAHGAADSDDWVTLSDGVFARIVPASGNSVSNAGVVVLDRGVLVFDTHLTLEGAQALAQRIRSVTAKAVQYVVNSHFHPDHTHGNAIFSSASCILSTAETRRDILLKDLPVLNRTLAAAQTQLENLRKSVAAAQDPKQREALRKQLAAREQVLGKMAALKVPVPVLIIEDSLTLEDGREVRLLNLGAGHTNGDLVMHLPWAKVAFVGDLFFNKALPNTQDARLLDWIKALGEIQKLDADRFVPGHGRVGSRQDLAGFLQYLLDLKAAVEPAVGRGDTLEQVVRETRLPEKYASWEFQNFFPANVQQMYVELKAQPPILPEPARRPETSKP